MKAIKDIILIAGIIFICLLLYRLINQKPKQTTETHYYYDTTLYEIKVNPPKPVVTVIREVPALVDTLAIIQDYYAVRYYRDTISDSSLTVIISDSISRNSIVHRDFVYRITRPVEVHIQKPVRQRVVEISAGAYTLIDTVASFGIMGGVRIKNTELHLGKNLTDKKILIGVSKKF